MDRIGHKARTFEEAARWDREQNWALTRDERMRIAQELRERAFGRDLPDVRESARDEGGAVRRRHP